MMKNKRIIPSAKEEHEKKVSEVTNMITAEDLVEQAVYAANAPLCCSGVQQADNMLNMLGANIVDKGIYHTPDEHPCDETHEQTQKM